LSDGDALELAEAGPELGASTLARNEPVAASTGPQAKPALPEDLQGYLDEKERHILVRALRETGFNRTLAAKLLGLTLRQIRYRIARLKIDAPDVHGENVDD
jgi:two-component system response regulator PilR (NtrC family)